MKSLLLTLVTCILTVPSLAAEFCDAADCDTMGCCDTGNACLFKELLGSCAEKGITFNGDLVQVYQGVTDGGLRRHDKYGGLASYGALFDFGKLGLSQGTFLQISAQSQFGESINQDTGALLIASNTNALLPTSDEQKTSITDFLLTQFLSENFAIFGGRLNTFGGDMNDFAHGRGKTQFMNVAMGINPTTFRTAPYVTYGVGFSILRNLEPIFSFTVFDPNDYATRTDLDELFSDGVTLSAETRLPTCYFGRPGHILLGGNWSNRSVLNLNQIPRLPISAVTSQPLPSVSESWAIYANFDHYLKTFGPNGEQGWGIFGRWGLADENSNPIEHFLSFGVGGNSPICGRHNDSFGIGWYHAGVTDAIPGVIFSDDGQGVEAYYSYAVNDNIFLSPDIQWIQSSRGNGDNAWVAGLRLFMTL